MKIKTVIVDEDKRYLKRLIDYFSLYYSDRIILSVFSDQEKALEFLKEHDINVYLISEKFEFDEDKLPENVSVGILVENPSISSIKNIPALCKYQKVEDIYKWIMDKYSENVKDDISIALHENNGCKQIAFVSYGNAAGATSLSIAFSAFLVSKGHSVCYLNLEKFNSQNAYFNSERAGGLSDLLYTVKSNKGNLVLKMESLLRTDVSGIRYLDAASHPMDLMDCTFENIAVILKTLRDVSKCEYLIIDIDLSSKPYFMEVLKQSNCIFLPNDGSSSGNAKLTGFLQLINIMEEQLNYPLHTKMHVIYNRFSKKNCKTVNLDIKEIGGQPPIAHEDFATVIRMLSKEAIMNAIYNACGESYAKG